MCRTVDVSATFQKAIDYFYLYVHMEKRENWNTCCVVYMKTLNYPFPE